MTAASPVLSYYDDDGVFAGDQQPYKPLPYVRVEDCILTRWRMTLRERARVLLTGNVYLWIKKDIYTALQPVKLQVWEPR